MEVPLNFLMRVYKNPVYFFHQFSFFKFIKNYGSDDLYFTEIMSFNKRLKTEFPNLDEPEPNKKRYNFTGWNY
jgi:hypothetical protein